ncbi:MAG: hypothetical protein IJV38_07970 [Prevotella sp.]|nr:hypothetical protein [Prevotella sp.]
MKTLELTRVGEHMSGNLYQDKEGKYYVDDFQSPVPDSPSVVYRLSPPLEPDGEPDFPITCNIVITNPFTEKEKRMRWFRQDYMMLSRMQADCKYYNSAEHFNRAHCSTIKQTIESMKEIWKKFPEDLKPEWISWEEIIEYEKKFAV